LKTMNVSVPADDRAQYDCPADMRLFR
jgi:hypothetical protein